MSVQTIILIVALGVSVLAGIVGVVLAIVRGEMKTFVKAKMVEAEGLEMSGEQKLNYVLQAVKEKYKIMELLLNTKKFIEEVIKITKQINYK